MLTNDLAHMMNIMVASVSYTPAMRTATRTTAIKMKIADKAGLASLAVQLNPVVGYWGAIPELAVAVARMVAACRSLHAL